MAASIPDVCSAQSCISPVPSSISPLVMNKTALAMILYTITLIPIGRTPSFLLGVISLQASSGATHFGSIRLVQRCLRVEANALHNLSEVEPKEVQIQFQS